ncbi:MAG: SAM-dependent methyltransferase [Lachnospiraceae bacterium]|nr:SAM-dependent methyltransferase [Lachnospiraceae bacterium]
MHWRGYGALMGLFSTRSPERPNPIGVSIVTVTRIERPSDTSGPSVNILMLSFT